MANVQRHLQLLTEVGYQQGVSLCCKDVQVESHGDFATVWPPHPELSVYRTLFDLFEKLRPDDVGPGDKVIELGAHHVGERLTEHLGQARVAIQDEPITAH